MTVDNKGASLSHCPCGRPASVCWPTGGYEKTQRAEAFAIYCFMVALVVLAAGVVLYVAGVRL